MEERDLRDALRLWAIRKMTSDDLLGGRVPGFIIMDQLLTGKGPRCLKERPRFPDDVRYTTVQGMGQNELHNLFERRFGQDSGVFVKAARTIITDAQSHAKIVPIDPQILLSENKERTAMVFPRMACEEEVK